MTMADRQLARLKEADEDEELQANQLQRALSAIANEVQKFLSFGSSSQINLNDADKDGSHDEREDEVDLCKVKLKSKEKVIRTLKENLSTACMIAKTALSSKEHDIMSHNNNLSLAQNESTELAKKNADTSEEVQRLIAENQMLNEKVKNMSSFIALGYLETQKMQNEEDEGATELPVLMQLKKIMVCCGQYYADYCNEREKSLQLEQKNRFLHNKLNILESSLDAVTDELKKFKCQKTTGKKGPKEKKSEYSRTQNIGFVYSDCHIGPNKTARTSMVMSSSNKSEPSEDTENCNSDLTSHLTLVKNLLKDQDSMLQDLKKLSNELESLPPLT